MYKLHFILLALITVSVPLEAHTGFYVGGQIGAGASSTKITTTYRSVDATNTAVNSSRPGVIDILGGAHIGYGTVFSEKWYAGLELLFDFANLNTKEIRVINIAVDDPILNHVKLDMDYSGNLATRLGYILDESLLLYLRLGVANSRWKFESAINTEPVFKKKKNRTGFVSGLGFSYPLTKQLILGAEYTYTAYKSFKADQVNRLLAEPHKIDPSLHEAKLKLSWLF